jgi:hypothetical protein
MANFLLILLLYCDPALLLIAYRIKVYKQSTTMSMQHVFAVLMLLLVNP